MRNIRLREVLIGVEGLALMRHLYECTDAIAAQRLDEIRRILDDDALEAADEMREATAQEGYTAWAESYDAPGNPVIAIEEAAVQELVDKLPAGRAIDAASGTGRHARYLASRGHRVIGLDLTREMLAHAGGIAVAQCDVRAAPLADGSADLVVSGLALAHLPELTPVITEIARVLKPGGHFVVSVLHPFQTLLGWHAPFEESPGRRAFVREHTHLHSDYLAAFAAAGLEVRHCIEPVFTETEVPSKRRAYRHIPEATMAAFTGLPGVLVWHAQKA